MVGSRACGQHVPTRSLWRECGALCCFAMCRHSRTATQGSGDVARFTAAPAPAPAASRGWCVFAGSPAGSRGNLDRALGGKGLRPGPGTARPDCLDSQCVSLPMSRDSEGGECHSQGQTGPPPGLGRRSWCPIPGGVGHTGWGGQIPAPKVAEVGSDPAWPHCMEVACPQWHPGSCAVCLLAERSGFCSTMTWFWQVPAGAAELLVFKTFR